MPGAAAAVYTDLAVFTGYLAFWAVRYVYESWQYKETSTGLIVLPIWIPQVSFSIGAVLLFVAVVEVPGTIRSRLRFLSLAHWKV